MLAWAEEAEAPGDDFGSSWRLGKGARIIKGYCKHRDDNGAAELKQLLRKANVLLEALKSQVQSPASP